MNRRINKEIDEIEHKLKISHSNKKEYLMEIMSFYLDKIDIYKKYIKLFKLRLDIWGKEYNKLMSNDNRTMSKL